MPSPPLELLSLSPPSLLCVFKSLFLCIWGHYAHNSGAQNWNNKNGLMKMKSRWRKEEEMGKVKVASAWKTAVKTFQGSSSADEMQLHLKTSCNVNISLTLQILDDSHFSLPLPMSIQHFIYLFLFVVALSVRDRYPDKSWRYCVFSPESTFSCFSKRYDAMPFYLLWRGNLIEMISQGKSSFWSVGGGWMELNKQLHRFHVQWKNRDFCANAFQINENLFLPNVL